MHVTRQVSLAAIAALVVAVGCSPQASPSTSPATSALTLSPVPTLAPLPTLAPTTSVGASPSQSIAPRPGFFAFDAESIVGYYATLGYACGAAEPSAQAVGYLRRACRLVDPDGRSRFVGIITDPAGDVAAAFTSITGTASEAVLEPVVALQPFSAFLGAVLGESQGESLLPWLAGNLGEEYATTKLGELTIATYTESPEDHSRLYLEIANRAFLESPTPSTH